MAKRAQIILAAMEDWENDENSSDHMSFDERAKINRPELIPLMDSLPPSKLPMPKLPMPNLEASEADKKS